MKKQSYVEIRESSKEPKFMWLSEEDPLMKDLRWQHYKGIIEIRIIMKAEVTNRQPNQLLLF